MRFLTVAAALFASTSLAVPTYPDNGGGACVSKPPVGGSSSYPGGEPSSRYTSSAPGTQPTGTGTTSGPGSSSTTSRRTRTKHTKPTHTKPTHTNTSSGPATTTTGSNTGSNTSTGPPTTSTGNTSPPGEFKCPDGLYSVPQCCSVDILGVADVDCASPNKAPTSGDEFKSICAAGGKQARCCVVPVLGQDVLCKDISGGGSPPGGNPPGGNPPGGNPPGGNPPGGNPPGGNPPYDACPSGLYSNLQCCATDVLGVADLDCKSPSSVPTSAADFNSVCAAVGQRARCCVVPVAGQSVLCMDPLPGGNPPGSNPPGGNPPGGNPPGGNPPGGNPPGGNPPGGNPPGGNPPYDACPSGLYSNLQCCATDVLGVADLDCKSPSSVPTSAADFKSVCAAVGQRARCCVVPVLGQAVLCETAVGTE